MPIVPALGRLKWEGCHEFQGSLGYSVRLFLSKTNRQRSIYGPFNTHWLSWFLCQAFVFISLYRTMFMFGLVSLGNSIHLEICGCLLCSI